MLHDRKVDDLRKILIKITVYRTSFRITVKLNALLSYVQMSINVQRYVNLQMCVQKV